MDFDLWRRASGLFAEAAAREESERADFVHARAGGDAALTGLVERLLAADQAAAGDAFLERPAEAEPSSAPPAAIGRYRVAERLGRGGFGEVFRAFDPVLKREVAIKTCFAPDEDTRRRFAREAEIVARLEHPNISRVYDFGVENEVPYLVQELLAGEDLTVWIERRPRPELRRRAVWLRDAARGLAHAHARGVVHRDVKPGNVRLLPDDTVKVLDFGIAGRLDGERALGADRALLGTLAYMAPERLDAAASEETAGPEVDVFGWAAVAWEILAGRRRLRGESPLAQLYEAAAGARTALGEAASDCPQELTRIVERGLAADPQRRYRNAGELLAELEPVVARLFEAPAAPRRSGVARWALGAAAAAALLAGAAFLARRQERALPAPAAAPVAAASAGLLRIDARPWSAISSVVDDAGRAVALPADAATPLALRVEAGGYKVTLRGANGAARVCAVAVVAGEAASCAPEPQPIDVDRFLSEVLR